MPVAPPAAILLVDDHALVRLGFRALLQAHGTLTGETTEFLEADTLSEAMVLYEQHLGRIGLVLLDLGLPDTQGLAGLVKFRARFPDARVAVLSGTRPGDLSQAALSLGAVAWLQKTGDLHELAQFLRQWREGASLPRAPQSTTSPTNPTRTGDSTRPMGARQQQVLRGVLQGLSNREIAQALQLGEGTVKNHITHLLQRFGMRSRAQLISHLGTQP